MPNNTTDQQITLPIGTDAADNPVAFIDAVADIEPLLVRNYVNLADRTARMLALSENDISTLDSEDRVEIYTGTTHISLYSRSLFAQVRQTAVHNLALSSTALQSVTGFAIPVPTTGTFAFRGIIYYTSSTVADIKFAFLLPAGGTIIWNGPGVVPGGAGTGDTTASTAVASDAALSYAGNGIATILACQIEGTYVAGGTAGNVQFRAAQNTVEATQSTIQPQSRLECWRIV